jgi:hypothetical protein
MSKPNKSLLRSDEPLNAAAASYLHGLTQFEEEQQELLEQARAGLPSLGYAIPMAAYILEQHANDAVDHVAPWGFADFSATFRILAETLVELTRGTPEADIPLFIGSVLDQDPMVERYLRLQLGRILALNERVSVRGGMRTVTLEGDRYRSAIADSRRRSALTLLRTKALYLQHSEEERHILDRKIVSDVEDDISSLARLTLTLDMREIDVLRKGLPDTWRRLLSELALEESSLLSFLAFTSLLPALGFRWLRGDELFKLMERFTNEFERDHVSRFEFDRLVELFASDAVTARRIGSVVPFLKVGTWFRSWPFVYHALLPELVFVSLVQSKRPEVWSATFGSDLAGAADYIAAQLPKFDKVTVVARRKKAGVGDIDLGIYDHVSGDLLICEIKTVFDRFRTEFQASNFTDQRVNFRKAVEQLNAARGALLTGNWSLKDVIGKGAPTIPTTVHRMVLLWRDHINPSLDDGDFVPACDFATFRFLFERCEGKPALIAESVEQLEKIFWVSSDRIDFWPVGDQQLPYARELETDALPPMSFLDSLPLNNIVREEVRTLRRFPSDWEEQLAEAEDYRRNYFISRLA